MTTPQKPAQKPSIRRALAWRAGGQIAAQTLLWASTFLVIRLLAPADYGLVAMAGALTGLLALLAGQGFASALIRAPTLNPHDPARALGLLLALNAGLAALQLAAAPAAAAYFAEPRVADLLRVQALAYLAIPFIAVPQALAQRAMNFRTPALIDLAASLAGAATTLTLALTGHGVWALVAGQLVPHAARALGYSAASRWLVAPRLDLARFTGATTFGGTLTLNALIWFAYIKSDILIAGRLLTTAQIGLYSTALFLALIPVSKLVPILTDIGFSAYSRLAADPAAVATAFLKTTRLAALATFPLFAGIAATAPTLAPVLLGPQWSTAATPLTLIAIAMPLYMVANLFGPAVNALGRPRVQLGNAIAGLAVMPVAFALGASHAGAPGLAAAWPLAYPLVFAISATRSLAALGLAPAALARAIAPPALAALLMGAATHAATTTLPATPAALVLTVALGAAIYTATLRLAFPARLAELLALARR